MKDYSKLIKKYILKTDKKIKDEKNYKKSLKKLNKIYENIDIMRYDFSEIRNIFKEANITRGNFTYNLDEYYTTYLVFNITSDKFKVIDNIYDESIYLDVVLLDILNNKLIIIIE